MGRPAVLRVDIVADAKKVGPGVQQAESRLGKLGGAVKKAGAVAALGVAAAGAAALGVAGAAVSAASELEQSVGAVESVFGKHAKTVERFAQDSATRLGLAGSEYRNLATVVGSQLKGMGRSQAEAATETDKLIGMGADLAATFGGSVSDAVGAVGSLLRGERDPIERYGVSITAADVQARLAAQGQDQLSGAALKTAQATATLQLLSEKTAGAHGAFARESNTLAGQQERLRAQFQNVKATLGTALLPMLTSLFGWVNTKVLPASKQLAGQLGTSLGPMITRVGGFIRNTLVPAGASLYNWFVQRIAPGLRTYLGNALAGLRRGFDVVRGAISRNEPQLRTLLSWVRQVAEFMANRLYPVVGTVLGGAFTGLGYAIGAVISTISWLVSSLQNAYHWVGNLVDRIRNSGVGRLASGIAGLFGAQLPPAGAAYTTGAVSLAGPVGALTGGARFAWSPSAMTAGLVGAGGGAGGRVIVDRRTYITVDGALDPVGTADRIRDLLAKADRRDGR